MVHNGNLKESRGGSVNLCVHTEKTSQKGKKKEHLDWQAVVTHSDRCLSSSTDTALVL